MSLTTEGGLLPCPFCGSQAELWGEPSYGIYGCSNADCVMKPDPHSIGARKHRTAKSWNARAPSQPVVGVTDEMVERSLFAYWNKTPHALAFNYIDRESMRAALTAALTPPPSKDG